MKDKYLDRTIGLIGKDNYEIIKDKKIAVFGLGGVGGTALEAIARLGFSHLYIFDFDVVADSNLNRQILYKEKDIGKPKVECAKNHLLEIDDSLIVKEYKIKVDENIYNILKELEIDFVVDAIDDVNGKKELAKYAEKNNIPIVVSLGMANRFNPTKVEIKRLDKTTMDPLARKVRYEYKQAGIETKNIYAVASNEEAKKDGNKLNSIITVPSSAGLAIAYFVLSYFVNNKEGIWFKRMGDKQYEKYLWDC